MLKRALIIIALLMSGVAVMPLRAQHYLFSHINAENSGLSYDSVREIFQDSRGYVWVGTYKGLCRYDGTRFKNYFRGDLQVTSDFINVIREDVSGNLWIGTDNGVVVYDYEEDTFVCLEKFLGGGYDFIPDDRIFAIAQNSKGVMWVSSRDYGLFSYDPSNHEFKHHPMNGCGEEPVNNIYRMAVDRNDNLYLAVYCDDVYCADPEATSCKPLDIGAYSDIFKGDDVEGLTLSGKSNDILYVACKKRGIVEVDLRNRTTKVLYALETDVRPTNLILDSNKYLWLSTTNGLVCHDLYTGNNHIYHTDTSDPFSLSDCYVTNVFKDDKGGLWVGTQYGGLNYHNPSHNNFLKCYSLADGTSLEGVIIRDFAEDKSGNIWVATERSGLLKYSSGRLVPVQGNLPHSVLALADDNDCLWIGSQMGISRMDYRTGTVKHYKPFDNEDRDNRVVTIYRSHTGDIYVATTIGVMIYIREADRFEMVPEFMGITIEHISEDSSGLFWLASYSTGVYSYDIVKKEIVRHYSPQTGDDSIPDMISSVCVDDSDDVWVVGFSSGFFRYDRENDDFETFSKSRLHSLPTDVFFMSLPDQYGNLWLSSDCGIIEFDVDSRSIRVFSKADGLLDNEFTKSGIMLRDGRMAFGSVNGFVIFNPDDFQIGESLSKVTLTDMYLNHRSVETRDGLYSGNIDLQSRITLEPHQNSFGFSFAVLDSKYPASDMIFCKLEGYDNTWHDVSVSKSIYWHNVPAGEYQLLVSNGEFSGKYISAHEAVSIEVRPKFWASPLGITIFVLIVILFTAIVICIFVRRQRANARRRIEEYRKKKDEELLAEKMTFFSNVIHEIKTPLTLIRTPLQKILASGDCNESVREEISVISSSADYMNDLVRELLEFVRLEEHGYVLDQKNIDIVERTGFLCFNFYETAKSRNIKVQFTHDVDSLETAVDTIAYRKILNNLLDNGVKYADTFIKVHLSRLEDNVVISFCNDGDLIPPSRREAIFSPFVQFSADKSPYSQSFGIGLAHARNLAELHGGTLVLADRDDCTEFILTIPVKVIEKEMSESGTDIEEAKHSDLPLVLVVEDNAGLLNYLKKNLKHLYNVLPAQSADKALALLASYKVDVILTDIALQGMSGVELCQRVNSTPEYAHIPVIVVSAISSVETKMKCMEYGAINYIEKPYSMDYLIACIKGALDKRATLRATYGSSTYASEKVNVNIINRDEDFLKRLEKIVLTNLSNPMFSNKQLEEMLFMGHSTLNRKMKALLDMTPNDYIRSKRLAVAAEMLAAGHHRVNEVCYAVGFNSPSYFAKCFKNAYGKLPAEWAKEKSETKSE